MALEELAFCQTQKIPYYEIELEDIPAIIQDMGRKSRTSGRSVLCRT